MHSCARPRETLSARLEIEPPPSAARSFAGALPCTTDSHKNWIRCSSRGSERRRHRDTDERIVNVRVAIHQPNFLPWMGLLNKIALCDVFVVLDHVQAPRSKGWLYRNRLLVSGQKTWLTVPIKRSGRGLQIISTVEINYDRYFASKHLRTICLNYKRAPYFKEIFPILSEILERKYTHIADLNMSLIVWLCSLLNLSLDYVKSSDLQRKNPELEIASGNDVPLTICRALNAKSYASGNGCLDFIRPESFINAGIDFYFQEFEHPVYRQLGAEKFVSHLSILDALFNVGPEETARMVCHSRLRLAKSL